MSEPSNTRTFRGEAIAFAGILGLAAMLRLLYIADEGYWFDELWIWRQVQMGFGALMTDMVEGDVHPPLYQWIVWTWARLFGAGELALRLPSAIFGVLAVLATARLGTQLYNRRAGLWAAGALACNEYAVYYSQEARSYSLLLLLSVLTVSTWLDLFERVSPRRLALYGLCGVALAYTHVFGVLLLMYLAIAWAIAWLRSRHASLRLRPWLAVHLAMAAVFALWVPALLTQASRVQQGFWIPEPEPLFFATYFAKFTGHRLLGLLALLPLGWWVYSAKQSDHTHDDDASPAGRAVDAWAPLSKVAFLVGWFAFVLGVPYVISVVGEPIMHAKSAISVVAPICVALGAALAMLPSRVAYVFAGLWLAGSLASIVGTNYLAQNREAWREMTGSVVERHDPHRDMVVLYHPDYDYMFCYHYYLDALAPELQPFELLCDGAACAEPLDALEAQAQARNARRLWLLKVRASSAFPPGLDAHWRVVSEEPFNNGVLQILEPR